MRRSCTSGVAHVRDIVECCVRRACLLTISPLGVAQNYSLNVLYITGLSEGGELITKWVRPSAFEPVEKTYESSIGFALT